MKLYSPTTIKEIKSKYGFHLSKSLGQNFLTDKNIIDKIVQATEVDEESLVIEIGPGIGVITKEIAQLGCQVIAVEIDKNLIPILQDTLGEFTNVEVINEDILKINLQELINKKSYNRISILGNLPYYITTPIIMALLEAQLSVDSIVIMMQKEVADRIKADPGSKTYGALSVAVQYYATVDEVAKVSKEVFIPQPKVDSSVLRLNLRKEPAYPVEDSRVLFQLIKAGFGQRRKTLINSLTGTKNFNKDEIREALQLSDIDEKRRAETLSLEDFSRLSNNLFNIKSKDV